MEEMKKFGWLLALAIALNTAAPTPPAQAGLILATGGFTVGLILEGTSRTGDWGPHVLVGSVLAGGAAVIVGAALLNLNVILLPAPQSSTEVAFAQALPYLCSADAQAFADLTSMKLKRGEYESANLDGAPVRLVRFNADEVMGTLACNYSPDQVQGIVTILK